MAWHTGTVVVGGQKQYVEKLRLTQLPATLRIVSLGKAKPLLRTGDPMTTSKTARECDARVKAFGKL